MKFLKYQLERNLKISLTRYLEFLALGIFILVAIAVYNLVEGKKDVNGVPYISEAIYYDNTIKHLFQLFVLLTLYIPFKMKSFTLALALLLLFLAFNNEDSTGIPGAFNEHIFYMLACLAIFLIYVFNSPVKHITKIMTVILGICLAAVFIIVDESDIEIAPEDEEWPRSTAIVLEYIFFIHLFYVVYISVVKYQKANL